MFNRSIKQIVPVMKIFFNAFFWYKSISKNAIKPIAEKIAAIGYVISNRVDKGGDSVVATKIKIKRNIVDRNNVYDFLTGRVLAKKWENKNGMENNKKNPVIGSRSGEFPYWLL